MPDEKNKDEEGMNVLRDSDGPPKGVPGPSTIHTLRDGEILQIKKSHGGWIIGNEYDRNAVVCFNPDEVVEWVNRWLVVTIDRMAK